MDVHEILKSFANEDHGVWEWLNILSQNNYKWKKITAFISSILVCPFLTPLKAMVHA